MHLKVIASVIISLIICELSFEISQSDEDVAESNSVLDPDGNIKIHWRVDYRRRQVSFKLHLSKHAPSFNWFAIGFSDRGNLTGADLCLVWYDYKGRVHFEDTNVDMHGHLHRDDQQDCKHFEISRDKGAIYFSRYFDTCDEDDYVVEDGTTHVVWAHGPDTLYSSEGLSPSKTSKYNQGFIRVRILSPSRQNITRARTISFTNEAIAVPDADTTYWCKVFKLPDDITSHLHHIVQFEASIQRGNEGIVHHMELFYCDADRNKDIPLFEGSCFDPQRPKSTIACAKVKAAWAMGALPFTYPEETGLPLGGPNSNKYVMLEVHYNNPLKKNDWIDSSGLTLHVTNRLRKYDAAIMELGLEYIDKMAIPPKQKEFPLSGFCIPECTGVGLPKQGIIVFGSQLHTHLTGVQVLTRHFRNGIELPVLNQDKHYSSHFQEIRILRKHVHVKPGDYLLTTCTYDTMDRINATIGGHAITDEMCVNYMHYYPATDLEVCKSSVSTDSLNDYFKFENGWDGIDIKGLKSPREKFLAIRDWTKLRVDTLHTLYEESPMSMQCNKSDGERFQGNWENIPIPEIKTPLQPVPRVCPE